MNAAPQRSEREHQVKMPGEPMAKCCTYVAGSCPRRRGVSMTTMLIAMRAAIIWWVAVSVAPIEVVYDAIESELERRDMPP